MISCVSAPNLGYVEFGEWYDKYHVTVLEPALSTASAALEASLSDVLSDRDIARLRNSTGRVKSKRRTWRKIGQPRYADRISTVDDIPDVIDDLIGLRLTCTNLRDIEMVQSALESLPRTRGRSLWLDQKSERDYVVTPKPSGYRGWHVNLGIEMDVDGRRRTMMCELQVRTLLQDSWGELTHEDTYSKDGALPPLVEVLSKRMADLFATLDDIAEDLRTELDRIDEAIVTESVNDGAGALPLTGLPADAAEVLVSRWRAIDRPTDMGSLAWALQREFGAEVSDDWFGHGSFKRFLRAAVPDGEISTGRTPYLLPLADEAADATSETETEIPGAATELHRVDRSFPLVESGQWSVLYEQLAAGWAEVGRRSRSERSLHELTRASRDAATATGATIARRHFEHVARLLLSADGSTGEPLSAADISDQFASLTLQRMTDLRIVKKRNEAAVRRWLDGSGTKTRST
jgi:ppGpp synthetase/RelA/SpoT-type nucleotidyltranferase